ncbi:MAG: hypothetical protein B7Z02_00555 [Rhodobacterales bacterium 32-67-9]|nr:MAG: hypothetical protein B7Z02_00555 [Rhodobacterales bacterium 32-67-9]
MNPARASRLAGALYLVIILAGVWGEGFARGGMLVPGDAAATAAAIREGAGLFRLALAADLLMTFCDAGVAVLLFLLLRGFFVVAALAAMIFRLIQTAVIAANMLVTASAGLLAEAGDAPALVAMELRALGYDIGLGFFAICNLLLGAIFVRSRGLPGWLGLLLAATGAVYLAGTGLHILAPAALAAFQPAYLVPLIVETVFAFWLLLAGPRRLVPAVATGAH